jgi:hypothetical protein
LSTSEKSSTTSTSKHSQSKPARVVLRAGTWYFDDQPCSGYSDALYRSLRAVKIVIPPTPPDQVRQPNLPAPETEAPESRIVSAAGLFYVDGRPYRTWRDAFVKASQPRTKAARA